MGRYVRDMNNNKEYKLWLGIQYSEDILSFSETYDNEIIYSVLSYNELSNIKEQIKGLKKCFKEKYHIKYDIFIKDIYENGYSKERREDVLYKKLCKDASLINLGVWCIERLETEKENVYLETEA